MISAEAAPHTRRSRRRRLALLVSGIAVVAIACFFTWRTVAGPSSPGSPLAATESSGALVVHLPPPLPGGPNWPSPASVSFRGAQGGMGIYGKGGGWATPGVLQAWPQIGIAFDTPVPPGAELDIAGGAKAARASVRRVGGPSTPIDLTDGVGHFPARPGSYELTVVGYWDEGSAVLRVEITVRGA
jgi:hypothetical protein